MAETLAEYAAGQLRATLARRRITHAQLAIKIGKDETWVRRRASGKYAITMADLELIADGLGMPAGVFLPESERVS